MTNQTIKRIVKKAIKRRSVKPISNLVNLHLDKMSIKQMQHLDMAYNIIQKHAK